MTDFWLAPDTLAPSGRAGGGVAGGGDIFGAMLEQQRLVENSNSAQEALNEGWEEWRRLYKEDTGQEPPPNPLIPRFDREDETARAMGWLNAFDEARIVERQQIEFRQFINEQSARMPREATRAWSQFDPAQYATDLARKADQKASQLMESHPGWDKFIYAFGGAAVGSLRDPIQLGSLALGGGPGAARTAIGRILATAASEAVVNAGVEAALQPSVQSWREQAGLEAGWDQALANIGFAALFAGGLGAGGRGLAEGVSYLAAPAPVRGAIQAGDMLAMVERQRPADIAPLRHEAQLLRAEVATRDLPPLPAAIDELQVSRLVQGLAPERAAGEASAADSFRGTLEAIRGGVSAPAPAATPRPVMQFIASIGGVDPDGPMASELRALGVSSRDMPGLFKRGGHADLDNIPMGEAERAFPGRSDIDDGNGYVSRQSFLDAVEAEVEGSTVARVADVSEERAYWERQGVDFDTMDDAEILDRMAAAADAEERWLGAGDGAKLYTDSLVRQVLELAGGTAPDHVVRDAVNLHVTTNEDLATAVEWALSDAAGVSRETPLGAPEFDGLGSRPPDYVESVSDELLDAWEADLQALEVWAKEDGLGDLAIPFGDEILSMDGLREAVGRSAQLERVVAACRL